METSPISETAPQADDIRIFRQLHGLLGAYHALYKNSPERFNPDTKAIVIDELRLVDIQEGPSDHRTIHEVLLQVSGDTIRLSHMYTRTDMGYKIPIFGSAKDAQEAYVRLASRPKTKKPKGVEQEIEKALSANPILLRTAHTFSWTTSDIKTGMIRVEEFREDSEGNITHTHSVDSISVQKIREHIIFLSFYHLRKILLINIDYACGYTGDTIQRVLDLFTPEVRKILLNFGLNELRMRMDEGLIEEETHVETDPFIDFDQDIPQPVLKEHFRVVKKTANGLHKTYISLEEDARAFPVEVMNALEEHLGEQPDYMDIDVSMQYMDITFDALKEIASTDDTFLAKRQEWMKKQCSMPSPAATVCKLLLETLDVNTNQNGSLQIHFKRRSKDDKEEETVEFRYPNTDNPEIPLQVLRHVLTLALV